jgi:hypothetical protein
VRLTKGIVNEKGASKSKAVDKKLDNERERV